MSKPFNIQITSDLHEDINKKGPLDIVGDILIIAGDLSDDLGTWEQYASTGKTTLGVLGNHEFMHKKGSVEDRVAEAKDMYSYSNVTLLYNDIFTTRGVNFIGTTLWSDISSVENTLASNMEVYGASGLSYEEWEMEHIKAVEFLESSLDTLRGETNVVITHFSPSYHSESPAYKDSPYGMYYHTGLEYLIREYDPLIWIHGHIHSPMDYYISSTRVIANPRGHALYKENPGFKERFTVSLI